MDKQKIIEALTELREANKAYDWVKPKTNHRLMRAIDVAGHLLDDLIRKEQAHDQP